MPRPSTSFIALSAAVALGAGGGAGAAIALEHPGSTTRTTVAASASGGAARSAALRTGGSLSVNQIYRAAKPGVVDIVATLKSAATPGPFGAPQGGGTAKAAGTGFMLDAKGDIVTNQHVVAGATSIRVTLADGRTATARVVGEDASSDVAVIHIDVPAAELHPLTFGDSSRMLVGDGVVAIGNPYGLSDTLTTGVVSALGRSITSPSHYTIAGAIQTDAAINHGNSGGPLLDSAGDVIGMNAQIESDSGDNNGLGFAIASNTVKSVASQLVATGKATHAYLGVTLGDGAGGASIGAVRAGSPAKQAGVRSGDVVTAIDGKRVATADEAVAVIATHKPGDEVTLAVRRAGGERSVVVTLGDRPAG